MIRENAHHTVNKSLSSRIQMRGEYSFGWRCSATRSTTFYPTPGASYVISMARNLPFRFRLRFQYLARSRLRPSPNHARATYRQGNDTVQPIRILTLSHAISSFVSWTDNSCIPKSNKQI